MQHCLDPIPVGYLPGQMPRMHPVFARRVLDAVACGKCKACRANRKNDWTGRLIAEATTSADVVFSTLTYSNEPNRFQYSHIQTMLRKMRDSKEFFQKNEIRFFCVGEKGTFYNRRHWHLLLFFKNPCGIEPHGRLTHPGQLWKYWPHGWADIQPLEPGQWAKKARYCAKYCLKDSAGDERYPLKSSLKPGIGDAFFRNLAVEMANAGLVPNGKYRHENMRWTTGRKAGQLIDFTMTGATRLNFIQYYKDAWFERYPDRPLPQNDWLRAWDDDGDTVIHDDVVERISRGRV